MRLPLSLSASAFGMSLLAACGGETATTADGADAAPTQGEASQSNSGLQLTLVADGLEFPWAMAFLPSGDMLVTEREGRLTLIRDGAKTTVTGGPEALIERQGGYLGLALDPDFSTNRTLYLSFAKGTRRANATAVFKAQLSADGTALTGGEVIYEATERNTAFHYGGRMDFLPDNTMLLTLGDGFRFMAEAQNPENTHGSIVRINTDGSIPSDNPLSGQSGRSGEIYSYGHRNVHGLLIDDETGTIYAHEHGPKGGDELNIIRPGANYGWPEITYGVNYDGTTITTATEREGMQQPIVKWVPSIAPSGMIKVSGEAYPAWEGDLLIGAMNGPEGRKLVRIDLENGEVDGQEDLLADLGFGYRDVIQGPDGMIYLATNDLDGAIYRLEPSQE